MYMPVFIKIVKTINVREKDNKPFEAISFPAMRLNEFVNEKDWSDSILREYLNKILFIPVVKKNKNSKIDEKYLGKSFFWEPSAKEEKIIRNEWLQYKKEVLDGRCKIVKIPAKNKKGYIEVSKLSKESQTEIIHMRPHGRDSNDRDEDYLGNSIVKQCFWLNKLFVKKLIEKNIV